MSGGNAAYLPHGAQDGRTAVLDSFELILSNKRLMTFESASAADQSESCHSQEFDVGEQFGLLGWKIGVEESERQLLEIRHSPFRHLCTA